MTARHTVLAILLALAVAGCAWVPTGLRIGGTPIERAEKKEVKEDAARDQLIKASQEAAHKTDAALAEAPHSRAVEVARDFSAETVAGLDQALGTPAVGDAAKWQDLVRRLLSEDAKVRERAESERNKDRAEIARLGDKLAAASAATVRAEEKAMKYAQEVDRIADMLRKVVWIAGGAFVLWILSQVLTVAARFNPALAGAASVVSHIAAPAVQFAYNRAKNGLEKVGSAMAEVQEKVPSAVEQLRAILDKHADEDHKAVIGAACAANGGNPQ